jgi:acyl-CoA dehydrogenase
MKSPFATPERTAFRETLRSFVNEEVAPNVDAWDEAGEVPWEVHAKLGALGVWGFGIDEAYGGLGFDDAFMRAIYSEELSLPGAGGVWAALNGRMISVEPIARLANKEIKDRALADIVAGRAGSCLGITEPGGGSDVAAMTTTARKDGDHYVLNGSKTFITGGMNASYFVVGARTGDKGLGGISLFFVDEGTPGFERTPLERKMGWWASDQATLYFNDCRVPASHLMGEENRGFLAIMENFNWERMGLIAGCLGMMRACLSESIRWAQERQTFGKPLLQHQVIRHKIAEMSSRIDAVDAYLNHICWQMNEGDMPVAEISKCKFFTTKQTEYVASEAMQILGGAGYLRGNPVERVYREVKVMAIGGGSEEIMRDLAVRQMGL